MAQMYQPTPKTRSRKSSNENEADKFLPRCRTATGLRCRHQISMNLNDQKGRLSGLTRDILLRWEETKSHWRDAKSDEFESRYLIELSANVNRTLIILEKLETVLKKVEHDCE